MDQPKRQTTLADYQARMLRVLVHIRSRLEEALDLDGLAAVAHLLATTFTGSSAGWWVSR